VSRCRASRHTSPTATLCTVALAALVAATIIGCTRSASPALHAQDSGASKNAGTADATARSQEEGLLRRHGLHPTGAVEVVGVFKLTLGSTGFTATRELSQQVGLDPTPYDGELVQMDRYDLQERAQGDGAVWARFCTYRGKIIAAELIFEAYYGGGVSLKDRRQLMPDGLVPQRLRFDGVKSVEVGGAEHLITGDAMQRVISLIEASVPVKGERPSGRGPTDGKETEDWVRIDYASGPQVLVRIVTVLESGRTYVEVDCLQGWYFLPDKALKGYVRSLYDKT
jgi:hypothetical protein